MSSDTTLESTIQQLVGKGNVSSQRLPVSEVMGHFTTGVQLRLPVSSATFQQPTMSSDTTLESTIQQLVGKGNVSSQRLPVSEVMGHFTT